MTCGYLLEQCFNGMHFLLVLQGILLRCLVLLGHDGARETQHSVRCCSLAVVRLFHLSDRLLKQL